MNMQPNKKNLHFGQEKYFILYIICAHIFKNPLTRPYEHPFSNDVTTRPSPSTHNHNIIKNRCFTFLN